MPESTSVGAIVGAKVASAIGFGALGALIMAAVDPPKTRLALAMQATVAGVCRIVVTPLAARWIDHTFAWIDLGRAGVVEVLEVFMPVGFLVGALSWGAVGALVKLREIVNQRAADKLAKAAGMDEGGKP